MPCPHCPHCSTEAARDALRRQEEERAAMLPHRAKVPGSDVVKVKFLDDRQRPLPEWVNPSIQPESIQKRMKDTGN